MPNETSKIYSVRIKNNKRKLTRRDLINLEKIINKNAKPAQICIFNRCGEIYNLKRYRPNFFNFGIYGFKVSVPNFKLRINMFYAEFEIFAQYYNKKKFEAVEKTVQEVRAYLGTPQARK